jgi:hypothetical protein
LLPATPSARGRNDEKEGGCHDEVDGFKGEAGKTSVIAKVEGPRQSRIVSRGGKAAGIISLSGK